MKFPCEIVVGGVLPSIRAALAEELMKKGFSQIEIAQMLGITQAAVSHYTSKKRGSRFEFSEDAKKELQKLADDLVQGLVEDLVIRICKLCIQVRTDEALCKAEISNPHTVRDD